MRWQTFTRAGRCRQPTVPGRADDGEIAVTGRVQMTALDYHINDIALCEAVLAKLDEWVAVGIVTAGKEEP